MAAVRILALLLLACPVVAVRTHNDKPPAVPLSLAELDLEVNLELGQEMEADLLALELEDKPLQELLNRTGGWVHTELARALRAAQNESAALIRGARDQAEKHLKQAHAVVREVVHLAQNKSKDLQAEVERLTKAFKDAVPAKKEEIAMQLKLLKQKVQNTWGTLAAGLAGSASAEAAEVATEELEQKLAQARQNSTRQHKVFLAAAQGLQHRLGQLRNAVEKSGVFAAAGNATAILGQRVAHLTDLLQNATASRRAALEKQLAEVQKELGKAQQAAKIKAQEIGEAFVDAATQLSVAIGKATEQLKNSSLPADAVAAARQRLNLLMEQRKALNISTSEVAKTAAENLKSLRDNVKQQLVQVGSALKQATADHRAKLERRSKELADELRLLGVVATNATKAARTELASVQQAAAERLGHLQQQLKNATGKLRENLEVRLASLQLRLDALRERAGEARAAAAKAAAEAAEKAAERVAELKQQLATAAEAQKPVLREQLAKLQEHVRALWAVAGQAASDAQAAVGRAMASATPAEHAPNATRPAFWRRLLSWR